MFFKAASNIEYVVVGLGNPGAQYAATRHNAGWRALDFCAQAWGIQVIKSKFDALYGTGTVNGHKVLLLKPQTFMNASGDAVQKAAAFYKVPAQRILVLFDDISLAPGRLRIRTEGSAGGHNGIKSIIARLGTEAFPRIKIGVGAKPSADTDLANWVLGKLTDEEAKACAARNEDIRCAAELMMDGKTADAMNRFNG